MQCDLRHHLLTPVVVPAGYQTLAFNQSLIRRHGIAKYESFVAEIDAFVFPCLARRDGCLRLMREIAARKFFVPEATWLCQWTADSKSKAGPVPVGTIQGLAIDGVGSIQNLGVVADHRGKSLGTVLLYRAAQGFRSIGINQMQLEVTTDNTAAVRLYQRQGFEIQEVVYKAAEILGAGVG